MTPLVYHSTRILLALMILFCIQIPGTSQVDIRQFGIEKFGRTVDQPFHSSTYLTQDEHGRLVFYDNIVPENKFLYDGYSFQKKSIEKNIQPLRQEGVTGWRALGPFIAKFKNSSIDTTIDVRNHLKRNISFVKGVDGFHFLFTNDGYIKIAINEDNIEIIESTAYNISRIYNAYPSADTLYLQTNLPPSYVLTSNPQNRLDYTVNNLNNSKVFCLTGDRVLVHQGGDYIILPSSSSHNKLLRSLEGNVYDHMLDNKNRLWMNIRNEEYLGVFIVNERDTLLSQLDLGIETGTFVNFFEDNLGDIWIGSTGQGLIHLYDKSLTILDKSYGLKSDNVLSISPSKNTNEAHLSLSCNGIDILENNEVKEHYHGSDCQSSIFNDSKGNVWITSGGLKLFRNNKEVRRFSKTDGLHSRTIVSIFEDSKANIWLGTRQVLHLYNGKGFIKYQIPSLDTYDKIFNIIELADGRLLLAVDNGQFYYFEKGKFTKMEIEIENSSHLFKDIDGNIWLATKGSGLFLMQEEAFIPVFDNDKMPQSIVFLQDSKEGLLFGLCADNTIFYCEKKELLSPKILPKVRTFTIDDGLPLIDSNEKIQPSAALLHDGQVVFPNIYGAIMIDPSKIMAEKDSFTILAISDNEIFNDKTIMLPYGVNDVSIDIHNIYLNPHASFVSEYRLEDEDWQPIKENTIVLSNLEGGIVTLEVRSKHVNGSWQKPIHFSIKTPYLIYERLWFQLLSLVVLLGMIYGYTWWRTNAIKEQNKALERKVNEQTEQLQQEKIYLSKSLNTQKELTKQLNLSQASKNRMYAQISHEFKSPLQAISAHLEKSDTFLQPKDKSRIKGNIDNLLSISNEIMDLSKAESGNLKAKKNYYNINNVIREQIELFTALAEKKKIHIETHLEGEVYLSIDISLIQKVITNLLSNAIKYTPENGTIAIRSEEIKGHQKIEVKDNGPGIPADDLENITLAYFQASNSTEDGTGIGLSLVKEILKIHDSELHISSVLGSGSVFSFELPLPDISQKEILSQFSSTSDIDMQLKNVLDPNKEIILAVDDSKDILHFLSQALTSKYYVIAAENGKQAIEHIEKINPHVVITDYNMPIMNGLELVKQIRNKTKYAALPILLFTGSQSEEKELQTLNAGIDAILQKPIQEELLISQVDKVLRRQKTISASIKTAFVHDLLPANIQNDDLILMQQLEDIFIENIENGKLKSDEIAQLIGIGEKTLRNRVKTISGLTIKEYFKNFRLEKAQLLLQEHHGTMSEIAQATGFSSLSYFSKSYKAYFGRNAKSKT